MSTPVPHVQVPASIERANRMHRSGEWSSRGAALRHLLHENGAHGVTWKEAADYLKTHHGTASALLSRMHEAGDVFTTQAQRNGCHVYVSAAFTESFRESERRMRPVRTRARKDRERLERAREIVDRIVDGVDMNRLSQYAVPTLFEQLMELMEVLHHED